MPMTEDRSNSMTLAALGMFSGAAAWALVNFTSDTGLRFEWTLFHGAIVFYPASVFPGLVFGLIIGVPLRRRGKVDGLRQLGFAAAAAFAYFCAFHVAFHVSDTFSPGDPLGDFVGLAASGIPAGLVGSLVLGLSMRLLFRAPSRLVLRLPVLVGGAAGALLGLIEYDRTLLAFFVLWQGAYAASLAPLLRRAPIPGRPGNVG